MANTTAPTILQITGPRFHANHSFATLPIRTAPTEETLTGPQYFGDHPVADATTDTQESEENNKMAPQCQPHQGKKTNTTQPATQCTTTPCDNSSDNRTFDVTGRRNGAHRLRLNDTEVAIDRSRWKEAQREWDKEKDIFPHRPRSGAMRPAEADWVPWPVLGTRIVDWHQPTANDPAHTTRHQKRL